ncbi:integrase core domain protein [archaeon BMS3Abin16]|nr:integrase core domain protein [archaeon BMS3Abin16]
MDIYEFRIRGVGKVRVFGMIDDHSRFVPALRIYKRKTAANAIETLANALGTGRKPRAIYVDNGRQFIAKSFRQFCENNDIKLIVGRPYNPQGRGKIEAFFKIMHRELISQVVFSDLDHAHLELSRFRGKYNNVRRHGGIGWIVPAQRYFKEMKSLQ